MNLKQMVGIEAAKYVEDGMIVGLGTGSTAKFMVDEIGRRVKEEGLSIVGVTTSKETEKSALIFKESKAVALPYFLKKLWPLIQRNVFGLWINQKWWTI